MKRNGIIALVCVAFIGGSGIAQGAGTLVQIQANSNLVSTANPLPVTEVGGGGAITAPLGAGTAADAVRTTEASDSPLLGRLPAALGTGGGLKVDGSGTPLPVSGTVSLTGTSRATYDVAGIGYTAYTTPTDMLCISGSASKTVSISQMYMGIGSTAAALQVIYFTKRSAANSGGTATNPAAIPYDSASAAASAVVTLYTAAPTTGTPVGNIRITEVNSTALTVTPGIVAITSPAFISGTVSTFQAPVILRGVAESLCMNYNGAALTTGFTANYAIEWTEY